MISLFLEPRSRTLGLVFGESCGGFCFASNPVDFYLQLKLDMLAYKGQLQGARRCFEPSWILIRFWGGILFASNPVDLYLQLKMDMLAYKGRAIASNPDGSLFDSGTEVSNPSVIFEILDPQSRTLVRFSRCWVGDVEP